MQRQIWWLGAARLVWGAVCLSMPTVVARTVLAEPTEAVKRGTQIVGARQFLEGLATWKWPRRRMITVLAFVDAAHATTMLGASAFDPRSRRVLAVDSGIATAWAVQGRRLLARTRGE